MFENISSVATQVVILFIIIGVGVILSKCRVLNKERVSGLIDIVVYIVTPANIIVSFQREFKGELIFNLGFSFLAAFIIFFINCVMAKLMIHEKNPDKNCVIRFASAFPNAGYFALPLQKAILGDIGVFYGAAYIAMFHCYIWTYGVKLLKKPEVVTNDIMAAVASTAAAFAGCFIVLELFRFVYRNRRDKLDDVDEKTEG